MSAATHDLGLHRGDESNDSLGFLTHPEKLLLGLACFPSVLELDDVLDQGVHVLVFGPQPLHLLEMAEDPNVGY